MSERNIAKLAMPGNNHRVCVIGAGPSGMSMLYQMMQLPEASRAEVVCFEKQATWGGLWNFSWLTGTDEYGEPCHAGMYKNLWANGPKEAQEYPDYPFEEHFGRITSSFPPRAAVRDYFEGRWVKKSKVDLKSLVRFNTLVKQVTYNPSSDDFTVTVRNLPKDETYSETFSHVVVANGIFNVPLKPFIKGIEHFNGKVIHSHDVRDMKEFKGQRLLVVGSSYSAEDVALQSVKYGAKGAVITYRTKPRKFKWPATVEERPFVQYLDGNTAHFKDGSSAEVDTIVLCTGYLYSFPFLSDDLRLQSVNCYYPNNLYKGVLWQRGGNNKLFYVGISDQFLTWTMFDAQALWVCKYIAGLLPNEAAVSKAAMQEDIKKWRTRMETLKTKKDELFFQTDYLKDLCEATGYPVAAANGGRSTFLQWIDQRNDDIVTFRDKSYVCTYTGNKSQVRAPWWTEMGDGLEAYLN